MLIDREHSMLLVVDMQTRLLPAIRGANELIASVSWLIRAARLAHIPVLATEQYPQGLGPTDPAIVQCLPAGPIASKVTFSCAAGRCFEGQGAPERQQVVICGIEAHVCVMQTALELRARGRDVFVVADAIGSRRELDKAVAIERLRDNRVQIITREMAGFEWLRASDAPEFKAFSAMLKEGG